MYDLKTSQMKRSGERAKGVTRREAAISVAPVQGGWRMEAPICGQPLMFRSGACAERQARGLARRLAQLGYEIRLEVRDRRDAIAGRFRYRPRPVAEGLESALELRDSSSL